MVSHYDELGPWEILAKNDASGRKDLPSRGGERQVKIDRGRFTL